MLFLATQKVIGWYSLFVYTVTILEYSSESKFLFGYWLTLFNLPNHFLNHLRKQTFFLETLKTAFSKPSWESKYKSAHSVYFFLGWLQSDQRHPQGEGGICPFHMCIVTLHAHTKGAELTFQGFDTVTKDFWELSEHCHWSDQVTPKLRNKNWGWKEDDQPWQS